MQMLKGEVAEDRLEPTYEKYEFGRLIRFTGTGFKEAGDRIVLGPKFSGAYDQAGMLVSYGTATKVDRKKLDKQSDVVGRMLGMDESTLPGDLLVRKSSLPIAGRMAAIIRQRSIDVATLFLDFLQRPGFSRLPPRGHGLVDIPTFRRCLCYTFGEQWSLLGMTSPEFMETYSPYIAREQSDSGDALILWKAFATDIMNKAGVDMGDLGYLKEEKSLEERTSLASNYKDFERKDLDAIRDTEYSHDIDTEEEKQTRVLKDVERVTGARSVAVTRYGSYESKLVGRNQLGTLKQGDFERIGGHGDYRKEQGVSADGSTVKKVNTQIGSQSHEYNADGTICVDTGGDVNQSLGYDASAAARATPYADDRRPKSAAVKRRSGSAKTTPRSTPRSTPRGSGASAVSNRSTSTPRAQRSARGPGAEKYKAVASQPGQFHGQFHAPSQRPKIVAGKVGKVVSTEGSQVKEAGDERRPTPRMAWGKIPATQ